MCYDGDVRVVEGERYGVGRVEVCKDNVWGTICDEGWDDLAATVACRAFRFDWGESCALCVFDCSCTTTTTQVVRLLRAFLVMDPS